MSNSKCALESERLKKHTDYNLQFNRWLLKPIGAWPQINVSSSLCKIMILLQIFICSSIIAGTTIPCLLYALFEAQNIKQKLNAVGPLINRFVSSVHYWVLLKRSDDIQKLIRHMETDWNLMQRIDEREVMMQHAKFGRFITIICGIMMQSGCLFVGFGQSIKTATIIIGNETFTTHLMTCPIYNKIIDARFTPVNEIALVFQNLVLLIISFCNAGGCSLAAVFAIHACGQLNVLYAWLHKLIKNKAKESDKAERNLAVVVERHLRILSFISQLESIMHKVAFVELVGSTLVICLLGYYIIMAWETFDTTKITSYGILYLSMCFNIFIFCYIGEIITEQCKLVGEMTYMTDWYNLHHKTARDLILIIARSNDVIKFTAGKLFHLSITTFGDGWEILGKTKLTSYLFPYLSTSFNIFIFCYIGGIVTEQCKLVGEMAYMTNWYNLHHTTARGLILIIARSNNVVKITVGKLFHLSIATFGDVIKTSFVYCNFLRTVTM